MHECGAQVGEAGAAVAEAVDLVAQFLQALAGAQALGLGVGEAQAFEGGRGSALDGGDEQVPGDAEASEGERLQGEGFQVAAVGQVRLGGLPE
ncbi:hypothetical protein ACFXOS_26140 [Streptomyces sp. NPDC059175]|uniref:hypothetical protein n=1 Tax=Streptomyces sp. NPDC059175 TaxID=3346757 RepID=UPI0036B0FC27